VIEVFYVYVLRSETTGRRYVGSCRDIYDRLRRHNAGESKATKHGVPWQLIHFEELPSRSAAIAREKYYKSGRGREEPDSLKASVSAVESPE
jgi:putative endonuclease